MDTGQEDTSKQTQGIALWSSTSVVDRGFFDIHIYSVASRGLLRTRPSPPVMGTMKRTPTKGAAHLRVYSVSASPRLVRVVALCIVKSALCFSHCSMAVGATFITCLLLPIGLVPGNNFNQLRSSSYCIAPRLFKGSVNWYNTSSRRTLQRTGSAYLIPARSTSYRLQEPSEHC